MRRSASIISVLLLAASPAAATRLQMPEEAPYQHYDFDKQDAPWTPQRPDPQLTERPIAEIVAGRLGIAEGKFELFHYRLENAPSSATLMRGVIDGGGLKLKTTW